MSREGMSSTDEDSDPWGEPFDKPDKTLHYSSQWNAIEQY